MISLLFQTVESAVYMREIFQRSKTTLTDLYINGCACRCYIPIPYMEQRGRFQQLGADDQNATGGTGCEHIIESRWRHPLIF